MKKVKEYLKDIYWIGFFYQYLKQIYLKIFYSATKAKEKYLKKQFKKHLIKRYNLENYMIIILCIQSVQINIE